MTFLELAKARYSVRKFKDTQIEPDKLASILEAGKIAPTATNAQPQKIFVLQSKEAVEKISSVCRCIFGAPTVLVIGYDKNRDWKNPLMPPYHSGETDASIVCTHMMLEAWEQGIGSCWVGFFNGDEVKNVLGLPDDVEVSALLPIGYPADDAAPSDRHEKYREDADMVSYM